MERTICTRNIDLTDEIENYINSKIDKLIKNLRKKVKVVVGINKKLYNVDISILEYDLSVVKTSCIDEDIYCAVDMAFEKIYCMLRKNKIKNKINDDECINDDCIDDDGEFIDKYEAEIKRRKKFNLKPMNVEEAIMQMDLLSHNFFIFRNEDNYEISVVYKRKNGGYGLIEHE